MSSLRHLYSHFQTYGMKHKHLYLISLMMFFWKLFDGAISYVTPLIITGEGISKTTMGLIYSSSSVFGAIFDVILSKYLKNSTYRKIFLLLLIVCAIHPLILLQAKTIWMYIVAMATWGLYYDLANIGNVDFVSRKTNPGEHVSSYGVIDVFRALGNLVAPIIAGLLFVGVVTWEFFAISWVFLGFAFVFLFIAMIVAKKSHYEYVRAHREKDTTFIEEVLLLFKSAKFVLPAFTLTILIFVYDAFFWTIGPIFSEQFSNLHRLNGLFLAAYSFPTLIIGWFVGAIASRFDQRKAGYYAFALACLVLIAFGFLNSSPLILFILVFCSSALSSIAFSTVKALFSDCIVERPQYTRQIETLNDLSVNIGYIVGPVSAGFLADRVGNLESFSILGIVGVVCSLLLLKRSLR